MEQHLFFERRRLSLHENLISRQMLVVVLRQIQIVSSLFDSKHNNKRNTFINNKRNIFINNNVIRNQSVHVLYKYVPISTFCHTMHRFSCIMDTRTRMQRFRIEIRPQRQKQSWRPKKFEGLRLGEEQEE